MTTQFNEDQLLTIWFAIGSANYWIRLAVDPPFRKASFHKCATAEDLEIHLEAGNWCLGQGFYYQNLCFINQKNGGDEWLTINDDYAFESITFENVIKQGLFKFYLDSLLSTTKE